MDKPDFDKIEGKTTVEAMELNREEDWVDAVLTESKDWVDSNKELMTAVTSGWLDKKHPGMGQLLMGTPLAEPVVSLIVLFLKMGWMKGKQVGEDKVKLEGIWKED